MNALEQAKQQIIDQLQPLMPEGVTVAPIDLEQPPQRELGDLAFPCFSLAKSLQKAPPAIAAELAEKFAATELVAEAAPAGPYINFKFDRSKFSQAVLEDVAAGRTQQLNSSKAQQLIIEYGQPNTHKEVHVGHLRNFFLGLSVVRVLRAAGQSVIPVSYIGDVGAHVAKCLWAYKKFHAGERPEAGSEGKFLGAIYTEASQKIEENEDLKEEVAAVQRALESGDPEWTALWQETRQWSLDEMNAIFSELGCDFERIYTESEVEGPGKELVQKMLADGLAKESQGALVMDLEDEDLGIFLLLKSDGSSLYATKELALAELKFEEYPQADTSIHVVDTRQSLYFQQFFATLKRLGFDKRLVHLAYDFVTLKEGAMSSRKGNVITYAEFRDQLLAMAIEETGKRHADWSEEKTRQTAWQISEAAMKFAMLKQDNDRPITFDPQEALAFEGFTGPYIQYAHARMCSILTKASVAAELASAPTQASVAAELASAPSGQFTEQEFALLRTVAKAPEVIAEAASKFRPSALAQYAFELAQEASGFYRDVPVISAEQQSDRERRLAIVQSAKQILERSLYLLGITAPTEM